MPSYMIHIWRSGFCPALVPAFFYEESGSWTRELSAEGLIHLQSYAAACPDGVGESFCFLLKALAGIAAGFAALQQWLADPAYICLDASSVFYDGAKERGLLQFSDEQDSRPFLLRFCALCEGLGESGGLIAERLREQGRHSVLEEKSVSAFLLRWEQEIRR